LIEELRDGRRHISVESTQSAAFMPIDSCTTTYPIDLIEMVLVVKGPFWLCDEILRDEDPTYVPLDLQWAMLGYVQPHDFEGKRLLDFGCGSGASTVILGRMFPGAEIVGLDLDERLLELARRRAAFYGQRTEFFVSPSEDKLPDGLGRFDFVSMSAVLEHLLPDERRRLLPQIWLVLVPGGILFVNQTPHRYFPLEYHTTGLPFINYMPPRAALIAARRFSRRIDADESWEGLLRNGVRGATKSEILRELKSAGSGTPVALRSTHLGLSDKNSLRAALGAIPASGGTDLPGAR